VWSSLAQAIRVFRRAPALLNQQADHHLEGDLAVIADAFVEL
jgi:hypothetical protein